MTPNQLKNSILQLAIQGKLVEQRPEEGTAEELYKQIQAEKTELIKQGKIKKDKNESTIIKRGNSYFEKIGTTEKCIDDELPFEIPDSWRWARLNDLSVLIGDGIHGTPIFDENGIYYFVNGNNLVNGKIIIKSDTKKVNETEYIKYKKNINENTVLLSINGTIGNIAYYNNEPIILGKSAAYITLFPSMVKDYISIILKSTYFLEYATNKATQTTIKNVSLKAMRDLPIPLPPLAEQYRIVAKIEELLPMVEKYGEAYNKLEALNKSFPSEIKKSILQYAIQGKLVEQCPEEGNAEELYNQIQAEKAELIKQGKIKKEKPLPPIKDEEIPFDIPETWRWTRWGDLSYSIQYGYNAPALEKGDIKMVRISDIQNGNIIWKTVPYCNISNKEIPTYLLKKNDILFARTGGTVGKSFLVKDTPESAIYAGYLIRTRFNSELLSPKYLKFFMESNLYWIQLREGTIATAQPNCNGKTLSKMILPLPPLAEQHRIVAKIEELFAIIDTLANKV